MKCTPESRVLLKIMESVESILINGSHRASCYFPDQHERNFYGDSKLVLKHANEADRSISYDLRRADDVANLGFCEAPEVDLGYDFEYDDRFVLAYRETYSSSELFVHRIVFGYDGSVRLHKRYAEIDGQAEISDCSAEEAYDILTDIFTNDTNLGPCDILNAPDPQIRALGLAVYHLSTLPSHRT